MSRPLNLVGFIYLVYSRTGRAGNRGYAYTFITHEQERYAGDLIKALELSGAPVPPGLEALWQDYKDRAKAVSSHPHPCIHVVLTVTQAHKAVV